MKPFTKDDLDALNESKEIFCNTCVHEKDCVTLDNQNVLSLYRDGQAANERWGCTIHQTEEEALEEMEKGEIV